MKRLLIVLACAFLAAPAFAQDNHARSEHGAATQQHRAQTQQRRARTAQHKATQATRQASRRIETAHKATTMANRQINKSRQAGRQAQRQTQRYKSVVRQDRRATQQVRRDYARYRSNLTAARRFHAGVYNRPAGWAYRRWTYGQTLPATYRASSYWLSSFASFGLMAPPSSAVWVRYGDDALLVDRDSGEIIRTEYNVFY